jgi:tetratricopeptide (TPR) repeat protein
LLQTAAVIGTEVPFALLQAIAELPEDALQWGLTHLRTAEFVYETNLYPEREYTFKHALTQEVAYGSLLQERRRSLHARIVASLESLAGDRVNEQVDQLAHHALRGEVWDKALRYFRQAGTKAMSRSAHREAVTGFEQALSALQHLPEQRDTQEQAIDVRFDLRSARIALGEMGRVLYDLQEAGTLAEALDDHTRLGRVATFMTVQFYLTGEYERGMASGCRAVTLTAASGDVGSQVMAHAYLSFVCYAQGDYAQAVWSGRQAVASLAHDLFKERFGQAVFPASFSRIPLSRSLAEMGAFAEAIARVDEALQIAEAVKHPVSLMLALGNGGYVHILQGVVHEAIPMLERAMAMCQDLDVPLYFRGLATPLGEAYTLGGRVDDAVPLLEEATERARVFRRGA